MLPLVLCLMFLPYVLGGSPCPPRREIYPCICIDRSIGKSRFHTTVICHGLSSGDSLSAIESGLKDMEIDKFLLYDSFWPTNDTRRLQAELRIPVNHISGFRMDEVQVVDSVLLNFGCPATDNCRTSYVKKFTAMNSSVSEKSSCNNIITVQSWVSCPQNVQQLIINKGFTTEVTLKPEFFPEPMSRLKSLLMPHNNIARIDRKTFGAVKFPVLHTLDLSYNTMRDVKNLFSSLLKLQYLDLSHNSIRSIVDFQFLTELRTLKLNDNNIINFLEYDWQNAPSHLRHIDLSNNNIHCNCAMKWVNSTFPINTILMGTCSTPPQVASMKLRRASRLLLERCDDEGKIAATKKPKQS